MNFDFDIMKEEEQFSLKDGKNLISFARDNIESFLSNNDKITIPTEIKKKFSEKYGAFVTLNKTNVTENPHIGTCFHWRSFSLSYPGHFLLQEEHLNLHRLSSSR